MRPWTWMSWRRFVKCVLRAAIGLRGGLGALRLTQRRAPPGALVHDHAALADLEQMKFFRQRPLATLEVAPLDDERAPARQGVVGEQRPSAQRVGDRLQEGGAAFGRRL